MTPASRVDPAVAGRLDGIDPAVTAAVASSPGDRLAVLALADELESLGLDVAGEVRALAAPGTSRLDPQGDGVRALARLGLRPCFVCAPPLRRRPERPCGWCGGACVLRDDGAAALSDRRCADALAGASFCGVVLIHPQGGRHLAAFEARLCASAGGVFVFPPPASFGLAVPPAAVEGWYLFGDDGMLLLRGPAGAWPASGLCVAVCRPDEVPGGDGGRSER